jgi:hypothetical protein
MYFCYIAKERKLPVTTAHSDANLPSGVPFLTSTQSRNNFALKIKIPGAKDVAWQQTPEAQQVTGKRRVAKPAEETNITQRPNTVPLPPSIPQSLHET